MEPGSWKDCTITIATSTTLSAETDLGRPYETMLIVMPTITSAQVSIKVAEASGGTFQDLYVTDLADGGNNKVISGAGTGGITWVVPLGGFQYIKLLSSEAQGANETFRVCGVRS